MSARRLRLGVPRQALLSLTPQALVPHMLLFFFPSSLLPSPFSFRLSCKVGPLAEGSEVSAKMQNSLTKSFLPKIQPPFMLGLDSSKHSFKSSSCGDCELFPSFALLVPSCPEPGPEGELSPCSRTRPGSCSGLESPGRVTGCGTELQGRPQCRGEAPAWQPGGRCPGGCEPGRGGPPVCFEGLLCCPQESPVCCVLLCAKMSGHPSKFKSSTGP